MPFRGLLVERIVYYVGLIETHYVLRGWGGQRALCFILVQDGKEDRQRLQTAKVGAGAKTNSGFELTLVVMVRDVSVPFDSKPFFKRIRQSGAKSNTPKNVQGEFPF